jgi:hypothetical protein
MSTQLNTSLPTDSSASSRGTAWPNWLREPLLHFIILGGLLFAIDHYLIGQKEDPNTIVITEEVDDEADELFLQTYGRKPDDKELTALQNVWLDNEVLYREGLSLQLDKGDDMIRNRVIFKALSVIDANVKTPPYDDKLLRDWFENHRAKYDEPARYDFQEAVIAGDSSEATIRSLVTALNSATPAGDTNADLRVFKARPKATLEQSYGADFAKALDTVPVTEWRAYSTREGWRAIKLDVITQPKPAEYDNLRGVVFQDWNDATLAEQRSAAVKLLAKKYTIKLEIVKP